MSQQAQVAPISERRGAVIAGALICAVLLVLGYGAGIGVVPTDDDGGGGGADGEAVPGEGDGSGGSHEVAPTGPRRDLGAASRTGDSPRTGASSTSPGIVSAARTVLPSIVPPSTSLPPGTSPGTPPGTGTPPPTSPGTGTPPSTSPGTTTPPSTPPPAECTSLVSGLLRGLVGYLSGPNPDAVLVQRVSDVLGLAGLLPSDSLLGVVDTSLVDSTLGSVLGSDTSSALALVPDAGLIPDLRALLGVDVTGVVTVTAGQLTALLDAVLGGC